MEHYPGEVYVLPPEADQGGDPKNRRHVLMSTCRDDDAVGSLAFASSSHLEASFGATHLVLDPFRTAYRGTGFDRAINIYLSRISSVEGSELKDQRGRVLDEMPRLRELLEHALGLGTGTCLGSGSAAGSMRGIILEFSADTAKQGDSSYGVVVCEPRYSKEQRFLHVVPIYGAGFDPAPSDYTVEGADWLKAIGSPAGAILAVELTFTVFYPRQVSRPLPASVNESTMSALDDALRLHFGL